MFLITLSRDTPTSPTWLWMGTVPEIDMRVLPEAVLKARTLKEVVKHAQRRMPPRERVGLITLGLTATVTRYYLQGAFAPVLHHAYSPHHLRQQTPVPTLWDMALDDVFRHRAPSAYDHILDDLV